jgi:2-keto-4-pentenoate hydratase
MQTETIQRIADQIKDAQKSVLQIPPITSLYADFDTQAAYQVARLNHAATLAEGKQVRGRKIGFTNPTMWPRYGVSEPMWGYMYNTTVVQLTESKATCRIGAFTEPRIEPEIVLHFHSKPALGAGPEGLISCIDSIAVGFEIVQSRYPDWKFQAPDTIAVGGLHACLLIAPRTKVSALGAKVIDDLQNFSVDLLRDGISFEKGLGSNVLGSPLLAVAHLIALLAKQPESIPVQAGELITTGTLTGAHTIQVGETWSTQLSGIDLPMLAVQFTS